MSPWSKTGSHTDLTSFGERSGTPQGLKLLKDREISQSKESLDISRDPMESGMKRIGSKESLKGKDISKSSVIQPPPPKEHSLSLSIVSAPVGVSTPRDGTWERSAPLKDTQASAEGSVESMQATFTQVGGVWGMASE